MMSFSTQQGRRVRKSVVARVLAVTLALTLVLTVGTPAFDQTINATLGWVASAQDGPPEVGPIVAEDALTEPGMLRAGSCPTQRNVLEFVEEGYRMKVRGKCTDASTAAQVSRRIDGLSVPDGEVRLELRFASGADRAFFRLWFRDQGNNNDGYFVVVWPATGTARLTKRANNQATTLAERTDLAESLATGEWLTLAVRADGPNLWVLVNDQPVLSAVDPTYGSGGALVDLFRTGDLNDEQEAAVIVRNLRVSGPPSGEQARMPTYQPPQPAAAPAPPAPAPRGDPWIGDIRFGYPGGEQVPAGSGLKLQENASIVATYAWRDVPVGSKIRVQVQWGAEGRNSNEFTATTSSGRGSIPVVFFPSLASGDWRYSGETFTIIVFLDGREVTRGSVGVEGI
jgi:hypothetical protein